MESRITVARGLWEQSLLAKQAPRFLEERVVFIAGKPCSHTVGDYTRDLRLAASTQITRRRSSSAERHSRISST
ncbi:hypothetical protein CF597_11775 [Pseudomonas sp. PSB1]|nr:hypothetical protein [Pseudomonas sp. PSB1]